jgi:hypothetical protein
MEELTTGGTTDVVMVVAIPTTANINMNKMCDVDTTQRNLMVRVTALPLKFYKHMHAVTVQHHEMLQIFNVELKLEKIEKVFFIPEWNCRLSIGLKLSRQVPVTTGCCRWAS